MLENGLPQLPALPGIAGQSANASGIPFSLGSAGDALLQGILHPWDTFTGNTAQMNEDLKKGAGPVSSLTSAFDFITDIPRVATTLLGLILIIAGIFALSRGPVINIAANAIKTAATT